MAAFRQFPALMPLAKAAKAGTRPGAPAPLQAGALLPPVAPAGGTSTQPVGAPVPLTGAPAAPVGGTAPSGGRARFAKPVTFNPLDRILQRRGVGPGSILGAVIGGTS